MSCAMSSNALCSWYANQIHSFTSKPLADVRYLGGSLSDVRGSAECWGVYDGDDCCPEDMDRSMSSVQFLLFGSSRSTRPRLAWVSSVWRVVKVGERVATVFPLLRDASFSMLQCRLLQDARVEVEGS